MCTRPDKENNETVTVQEAEVVKVDVLKHLGSSIQREVKEKPGTTFTMMMWEQHQHDDIRSSGKHCQG